MNERRELAEQLEQARVCYWGVDDPAGIYLYPYERDMIIAALREHEAIERLREELATCHELRTFDAANINILRNTIKNCPPVSESEYVRRLESEYEAVAALRTPALPSEEEIARVLPKTPRDVIAGHMRNWGHWGQELAYNLADTLIAELTLRGFHITRVPNAK